MSVANPSGFERTHFDALPVNVDRNGLDIASLVGVPLSDMDIQHLSGAPAGAKVLCEYKASWSPGTTGADKPDPGLYFYVWHQFIHSANCIGLALVKGHDGIPYMRMYIKDVFLNSAAPPGLAGAMVARIARRCLRLGISEMRLLAAGGRRWPSLPTGQRWGGYVAWARYGFDMPLLTVDTGLFPAFPYFPAHLLGPPQCSTVQELIRTDDGLAWWKLCGNGHFMSFDCSKPNTDSIVLLDRVLAAKGI